MINRHIIEAAFQDWYTELRLRTSLVEFLGGRLDRLLFTCFRNGFTRGHAQGMADAEERASARRQRLEDASLPPPRRQGRPAVETVVTSRNEAGTASAIHIPVVIEGTVSLDRERSVGEYLEDE
jgi:hypothetical protein